MKMITAIIKPFKLDDIHTALVELNVYWIIVTEVKCCSRQKGHIEMCRGVEYMVDFLPKLKIEVVVEDSILDLAIEAVQKAAQTGKIGDGKIFVSNVEQAIRIHTGEYGDLAL